MEILIYDDPGLRRKAEPIEKIEPRHEKLAADMTETMYDALGIGLAAVQVGVLERMIVVDVEWARAEEGEEPPKDPTVMINPQVLDESAEDESYKEGCLSLPNIEGDVWRPKVVRFRYETLEGEIVERSADELLARCIQHEIDHLDGVLFIDRMSETNRKKLRIALQRLNESRGEPPEDAGDEAKEA